MADNPPPPPQVDPAALTEVAPGVHVIGDRRVPLVPNIGIVIGGDAVLVVDTGMGPANGGKVLETAGRLAGGRRLILTLTHFHPEHAFGAQVFKGVAPIVYNAAQRDEFAAKGGAYLDMFRSFGPGVAAALEGTELVIPDEVYDGPSRTIDLGGRTVELATYGAAHTRGDQVVSVPDAGVVFVGDLAEERIFPISPGSARRRRHRRRQLGACARLARRRAAEGRGSRSRIGRRRRDPRRGARLHAGPRQAREGRVDAGRNADEIVAALAPQVRAEHPDWEAPEWIDFAIRYFAAKPLK